MPNKSFFFYPNFKFHNDQIYTFYNGSIKVPSIYFCLANDWITRVNLLRFLFNANILSNKSGLAYLAKGS